MYDFDDYDEFLDDYDDLLDELDDWEDELDDREEDAYDMYESEVDEIDDYWDRENKHIKNSGIYTEEEVQQILANNEEMRRSKKNEAQERYELERDRLRFNREQVEHNREMAESEREIYRMLEEKERPTPGYNSQPVPRYERPSLLKRALAFAGAYHLFKKIFFPK